jgi:hypothetical protein
VTILRLKPYAFYSAEALNLDWHMVKRQEKHYIRKLLKLSGTARPKGIGINEISIRKRHDYIVVSDLERHRPIWVRRRESQRCEHGCVLSVSRRNASHTGSPGSTHE